MLRHCQYSVSEHSRSSPIGSEGSRMTLSNIPGCSISCKYFCFRTLAKRQRKSIKIDCIPSLNVNITLKLLKPIKCQLLEEFVLTSMPTSCDKMIGYHHCRVTNHMQVSASCDVECGCKVTNGESCNILLMIRQKVGFQSISLSEIDVYFKNT